MTHYLIKKSSLNGEITLPSSKSQTMRALLFAAMADGESTLHNLLMSPDTEAMLTACRTIGAKIRNKGTSYIVKGVSGKVKLCGREINAENSGIILRFITGLVALNNNSITMLGDQSVVKRPMYPLIKALKNLGAQVTCVDKEGFAPITVSGPITGNATSIEGADSQFVSSLLIAGAFAAQPLEISVNNPGEKPWVDMTLDWFDRLGIQYKRDGYSRYSLEGNTTYPGFEYTIPSDLSSMAFPLAAALITNSTLTINEIDLNDPQGDKMILEILNKMGARFEVKGDQLHVPTGQRLKGIKVDINECIDAITILAVLGCYSEGVMEILNAKVARTKECDRIACITRELKRMGANIEEIDGGLIIRRSKLHGAALLCYRDHRMVMSLAVAAMGADGESVLEGTECVNKTFPSFFQVFKACGADFEVIDG